MRRCCYREAPLLFSARNPGCKASPNKHFVLPSAVAGRLASPQKTLSPGLARVSPYGERCSGAACGNVWRCSHPEAPPAFSARYPSCKASKNTPVMSPQAVAGRLAISQNACPLDWREFPPHGERCSGAACGNVRRCCQPAAPLAFSARYPGCKTSKIFSLSADGTSGWEFWGQRSAKP